MTTACVPASSFANATMGRQQLAASRRRRDQMVSWGRIPQSGLFARFTLSPEAFQVPNALALPYYGGLIGAGFGQAIGSPLTSIPGHRDPYASVTQSTDLRVIESGAKPCLSCKKQRVSAECRLCHYAVPDGHFFHRLQQRLSLVDGGLQSIQYAARNFCLHPVYRRRISVWNPHLTRWQLCLRRLAR